MEITVFSIEGDKVRLGIKAPAELAVYRRELFEAIKRENRRAARSGVNALDKALDAESVKTPSPPARARRRV